MSVPGSLLALHLGLVTGFAVGVPGEDAVSHGAWRFDHGIRLDMNTKCHHGEICAAFLDALSDHLRVHQPRGLVASALDDDPAEAVLTVKMIGMADLLAYRKAKPIAIVSPSAIKVPAADVARWHPRSRAATEALRLWKHARLVARSGAVVLPP